MLKTEFPELKLITISSAKWEETVNSWIKFIDYEVQDTGYLSKNLVHTWNAPNNEDSRYAILTSKKGDQSIGIRIVENLIPTNFEPLRTFGWASVSLLVQNLDEIISQIKNSPFEIICPIRSINFNQRKIRLLDIRGIGSEVISLAEINDVNEHNIPFAQCSVDRPFMVTLATRDIETTKNFYYNKLSIEKVPDIQAEIWPLSDAFQYNRDTTYALTQSLLGEKNVLEINEYPEDATRRNFISGNLHPGICHITITLPKIDELSLYWLTEPIEIEEGKYKSCKQVTFFGATGELVELIEHSSEN
ncbi:MAG: hypothetical protein CFH01_00841 [Alphaproteobacteria bacterium MarineAlpha2_Bin1]|nr:MAG: hypothetical protein CFH01_00841 [Alphaproteobacteria bacterium MarineAlpha2_Bin1]